MNKVKYLALCLVAILAFGAEANKIDGLFGEKIDEPIKGKGESHGWWGEYRTIEIRRYAELPPVFDGNAQFNVTENEDNKIVAITFQSLKTNHKEDFVGTADLIKQFRARYGKPTHEKVYEQGGTRAERLCFIDGDRMLSCAVIQDRNGIELGIECGYIGYFVNQSLAMFGDKLDERRCKSVASAVAEMYGSEVARMIELKVKASSDGKEWKSIGLPKLKAVPPPPPPPAPAPKPVAVVKDTPKLPPKVTPPPVAKPEPCKLCKGSKFVYQNEPCAKCRGEGKIATAEGLVVGAISSIFGEKKSLLSDCKQCKGTGVVRKAYPCPKCK